MTSPRPGRSTAYRVRPGAETGTPAPESHVCPAVRCVEGCIQDASFPAAADLPLAALAQLRTWSLHARSLCRAESQCPGMPRHDAPPPSWHRSLRPLSCLRSTVRSLAGAPGRLAVAFLVKAPGLGHWGGCPTAGRSWG